MNSEGTPETPANQFALRFGCDRDVLEHTLSLVQAGEISPSEATRRLLSPSILPDARRLPPHPVSAPAESLASLIDRLGIPPTDIVDSWCRQMRLIAGDLHAITGQSLPAIDLHAWSINQSGQLLLAGHGAAATDTNLNADIDAKSRERIQCFRNTLIPNPSDAVTAFQQTTPATNIASSSTKEPQSTKDKRRQSATIPRCAIGTLVVAGFLVIGWILFQASNQHKLANTAPGKGPSFTSPTIDAPSTAQPFQSAAIEQAFQQTTIAGDASLESFDGPGGFSAKIHGGFSDEISMDALQTPGNDQLLSLNSIMPAASGFSQNDAPIDVPTGNEVPNDNEDPKPNDLDEIEDVVANSNDPLVEDTAEPEESPQPIRKSEITSVTLPATNDGQTSTKLGKAIDRTFRLQFPFDVALGLRDTEDGREVIDVNSEVAVATIIGNDAEEMAFRWTATASKSSASTSLLHGRLKTRSDNVVYLRPAIEADLWPLDVQKADVRPTWDLSGPMPPRVTRFSIEFDLPEGIEEGWIEPIDSTSPRRSRALAVLTDSEVESVALGVRFDIRGGRKLSCRLRYAAKLDPSAAWQMVSRPMLEQSMNQLTIQSELTSQQLVDISAMYANADSSGRRFLAPQRDALKQRAELLRQLAGRVTELQSLIAKVETAGKLKLRVWVDWPDGSTQTLLETGQ